MYSKVFNVAALLVLFFFVGVSHAAGMKIEPGLWETKSNVTTPAGAHENVSQECIKESEISPEKMMDDNTGCQVTDSNSDSNTMRWTINCVNEGVSMTGSGQAQSSGDSMTGEMDFKANFNGQEFVMTTTWEGTRLGGCN